MNIYCFFWNILGCSAVSEKLAVHKIQLSEINLNKYSVLVNALNIYFEYSSILSDLI